MANSCEHKVWLDERAKPHCECEGIVKKEPWKEQVVKWKELFNERLNAVVDNPIHNVDASKPAEVSQVLFDIGEELRRRISDLRNWTMDQTDELLTYGSIKSALSWQATTMVKEGMKPGIVLISFTDLQKLTAEDPKVANDGTLWGARIELGSENMAPMILPKV